MPEIGYNSWTTGEGADVLTDLRAAALAGYAAIEICDWKIERFLASGGRISDLQRHVSDAGLRVLTINTLDDSTLNSDQRRAELIERCGSLCSWAQALNCPYIIAGPSYSQNPDLGSSEVRKKSAA